MPEHEQVNNLGKDFPLHLFLKLCFPPQLIVVEILLCTRQQFDNFVLGQQSTFACGDVKVRIS